MSKGKNTIPPAKSYRQIGEFWDTHDLGDYWDQTKPAEFEVDLQCSVTYFAIEEELAARLRSLARRRGISSETLLNLWVQEKVTEGEPPKKRASEPAPRRQSCSRLIDPADRAGRGRDQ